MIKDLLNFFVCCIYVLISLQEMKIKHLKMVGIVFFCCFFSLSYSRLKYNNFYMLHKSLNFSFFCLIAFSGRGRGGRGGRGGSFRQGIHLTFLQHI